MNKMATLGDDLEKALVIKKVLRILLPKWDNVALVIEETKDISTLKFDQLVGSLISQEERFLRRSKIGTSEEQAFSTRENDNIGGRSQGRGTRGRGQNDRGGRRGSFGRGRGRDQILYGDQVNIASASTRGGYTTRGRGRDKRNVQCYHCNKFGHFGRECRLRQASQSNQSVNYGEEEDSYGDYGEQDTYEEDVLFLSIIQEEKHGAKALISQEEEDDDTWVLDSGCSHHMIGKKKLLSSLDHSFSSSIKLGNEKLLDVVAKGDMMVPTKRGTMKVKSIYFAPDLK